jgi:TPR repeat protein
VPTGCFNLGVLHRNGEGVPAPDFSTARLYFERACQMGDETGCSEAQWVASHAAPASSSPTRR